MGNRSSEIAERTGKATLGCACRVGAAAAEPKLRDGDVPESPREGVRDRKNEAAAAGGLSSRGHVGREASQKLSRCKTKERKETFLFAEETTLDASASELDERWAV